MSEEWCYPVNDRSDTWGYPVDAVDFFAGKRAPGEHSWHLARHLQHFGVGDYIWVRASAPVSAFVGLGQVASELEPDGDAYRFRVVWGEATSQRLSADPVPGIVSPSSVRQTRRLTPAEATALHKAAGGLPAVPPVPAGKIRRLREVTQRQGQPEFRASLLRAYGRCAVTGTVVPEVLQAAHIERYDGPQTNSVDNGLLLRADIHDLFDRGLLWVTARLKVGVHEELRDGEYGRLHGRRLHVPQAAAQQPSARRLQQHRREIAGRPA